MIAASFLFFRMPRGARKNITIPGLLAPTVKQRCAEFGAGGFAPYAVELVCYDLRADAKHAITLEVGRRVPKETICGTAWPWLTAEEAEGNSGGSVDGRAAVLARAGEDFGSVQREGHLPHAQHAHLRRDFEHLVKTAFEQRAIFPSERADAVVIRMPVRTQQPHRDVLMREQLDAPAAEGAARVAVR